MTASNESVASSPRIEALSEGKLKLHISLDVSESVAGKEADHVFDTDTEHQDYPDAAEDPMARVREAGQAAAKISSELDNLRKNLANEYLETESRCSEDVGSNVMTLQSARKVLEDLSKSVCQHSEPQMSTTLTTTSGKDLSYTAPVSTPVLAESYCRIKLQPSDSDTPSGCDSTSNVSAQFAPSGRDCKKYSAPRQQSETLRRAANILTRHLRPGLGDP